MPDRAVRAGIDVAAPREIVWAAWAEPEKLAQWFSDSASGEFVPGGTVVMNFERFGLKVPYRVLAAERPTHFAMEASLGAQTAILEVTLEAAGGGTRLTLINTGCPSDPDAYESVVSGWGMALPVMRQYIERYFGRPRTSFFSMRPAAFTYERALHFYRRGEDLARWLTRSGEIGAPGEPYQLTARNGSMVSGRVLAVTSREVALGWDEIRGVLELKAFPTGPGKRALAIRGCGWDLAPARAEAIEQEMSAALARLEEALLE